MNSPHPFIPSPELQTLFEIAERASDNAEKESDVYLNDVDYERVRRLAARHGMAAMLEREVGVREGFDWNTGRNLRMTGELAGILRAFDGESMRVISYKGPALAWLAYGDLGSREFGDLDLLIERDSFSKAFDLMTKLGYEAEIDLEAGSWSAFTATTNVLAWWHPSKEVSVELHWELSPWYLPFPIGFDNLYGRRQLSYPGGREVETLSTEDLLVFLCLHGAKHGWERMSWIIDLGGLIRRAERIDWRRMMLDARECRRAVWLGLALAREVTKVPLPAEVVNAIDEDIETRRLVDLVLEWLERERGPSMTELTSLLLRLRKGPLEKARMLTRIVLTPSVADWRAIRLPASLAWFYRVLRPFRLLVKGF